MGLGNFVHKWGKGRAMRQIPSPCTTQSVGDPSLSETLLSFG